MCYKFSYDNQRTARRAVVTNQKKYGGNWNHYTCSDCGEIHIGHTPRENARPKLKYRRPDHLNMTAIRQMYCG